MVLIRFKSDGSLSGNGFEATYRAIGNSKFLKISFTGSDKGSCRNILFNISKSFRIRNRFVYMYRKLTNVPNCWWLQVSTYSMKQPDLYHYDALKVTSQFQLNFGWDCDVFFMVSK